MITLFGMLCLVFGCSLVLLGAITHDEWTVWMGYAMFGGFAAATLVIKI